MQTKLYRLVLLGLLLIAAVCSNDAVGQINDLSAAEEENQTQLYMEQFRPQFHWSPTFGWMNDPNGMIWFEGEYNLFFQYNPYATSFGNIGWGHAVSDDLFHWQPLPVAIPPEGDNLIFSGCAVLDENNTCGLCDNPDPGDESCLVAIYTTNRETPVGFNQTQDLAFSNDGGVTWTKFEGNPILDRGLADFRDPKVFWYEPDQRWIMVIALPLDRQVQIFGSPNLRDWEELSTFGPVGATGGVWECPDLFPMEVVNEPETTKWVMVVYLNPGGPFGGSAGQYFIGEFTGTEFIPEIPANPDEVLWLDYGKDFYCATTYANLPPELAPRWIAWMNNWQYAGVIPTFPWRGSMSVPRTLSLEQFPEGLRLRQQPVPEIEELYEAEGAFVTSDIEEANTLLAPVTTPDESWQMTIRGRPEGLTEFGVHISSVMPGELLVRTATVGYNPQAQELFVERPAEGNVDVNEHFPGLHFGPLPLEDGEVQIRLLVDKSKIEVFGNEGRTVISDLIFPLSDDIRVEVFADGGIPENLEISFTPIDSVWR